ncbi:twin-arginine translocase subunit TatB [Chitinimonas arctica]|uniref:Sec-independent protein translocase protein TatB n=1 Tax=Chitinimonas arctica TaxID=2594795 RepID=A0A516SE96_9NEIS|nr:Sec-independent protein translocase protein TatB [Chitinimonas arctica]QDQ26485.1 twin-arginine translocase subunit TatB [Chitinimonas arctica]
MFDFSLGELVVVGTVALIVIGPERLPTVARTVGAMVGRLQRYVAGVKADIQREVELDNLKRLEAEMNEAGRKLRDDMMNGVEPVKDSLRETAAATHDALSEPPTHSGSVAAQPHDDKQFDLFNAGQAYDHPPEYSPDHRPPPERDRR